jgi:hypothetical protein
MDSWMLAMDAAPAAAPTQAQARGDETRVCSMAVGWRTGEVVWVVRDCEDT